MAATVTVAASYTTSGDTTGAAFRSGAPAMARAVYLGSLGGPSLHTATAEANKLGMSCQPEQRGSAALLPTRSDTPGHTSGGRTGRGSVDGLCPPCLGRPPIRLREFPGGC